MNGGRTFDVAVIGAGVFGAWTAWHLAKRGQRVALIDAYGPAHSRASSGGETRIIRMGYGGDELYTRWVAAFHWSNGRSFLRQRDRHFFWKPECFGWPVKRTRGCGRRAQR